MIIEQVAQEIQRQKLNVFSLCEYEEKRGYTTKHLRRNNARNNVYSVAKTVVSLVVGMLEERGILDIDNISIWDVFPERNAEMNRAWKEVFLHHVMTHTTGFGIGALDVDQEDPANWDNEDFLELVLRQPLVYRPGERMVYSDANYYLISRVIAQKSGKTLQSLAREMLFCPLTLYNATWETCPKGYAIGASGLFLTVENMAKLGVLMLHNGMWNGKQLVSEDWIRQMRQERTCTSEGRGYGYGVWLQRDTKAYTARGMQGQFIFISPQTGRIIACQSCEDDDKMDPLLDLLIQLDNEDFI